VMVKEKVPVRDLEEQAQALERAREVLLQGEHIARTATDDGVWVEYEDRSWVHVRASNTEPILRIIAEHRSCHGCRDLVRRVREASP